MQIYLVGGAVRDRLLQLPVKDRDWVVVGATPEEMLARGYAQVGKGFPVFLHPTTKQEYALARTERKIAPGHNGFEFDTTASVTLEQDLSRRDLTINAIAETESGELIDPYGGCRDIEQRLLRHVSAAFSEDPLRVLRVARFAARFAHLGFTVAPETLALMRSIVASGELATLVKERVWQELEQALRAPAPQVFIEVLRDCGALAVILPEVDALFGVPQPAKYHPEIDTGVHILMCLQQAVALSDDPVVRFAVLVHDVGKGITDRTQWPSHYGHETLGLKLLDTIADRLPVPREYAELARLVCEHHTKLHRVEELRPSTLLTLLETIDAFRRPQRLQKFLLACEADARGRTGFEQRAYPQSAYFDSVLQAAQTVDIPTLLKNHGGDNPQSLIARERQQAIAHALEALRHHD
jgi:tRNA nucleotidyltransferase (CCA-adding enzyme)